MSITTCERCDRYVDTDFHEMYEHEGKQMCEAYDVELSADEQPMPVIESETADDITAADH